MAQLASERVWWAVRDLLRAGLPVRFLLPGGEATGLLKLHPSTGGERQLERQFWVRRDSGALDRLDFEPDAWRPLDGHIWPDPLPQPITLSSSGRFTDIRPRKFSAMQRQAEQSAAVQAEMEAEFAERDVSRGKQDAAGSRRKNQWWLDPTALTHSEPGQITLAEAEARVSRAILTDGLKAIDGRPVAFAGVAAGLASMVAESLHSDDADRRPRFEATPRDHADYIVAMGWFARMTPIELRPRWAGNDWLSGGQKVLVWRALLPPWSWRQIARHAGGSQEGWRKTWGGALACVHRVANGEPAMQHVSVADQLAALRERNTAWKRKRHAPVEIQERALVALADGDGKQATGNDERDAG